MFCFSPPLQNFIEFIFRDVDGRVFVYVDDINEHNQMARTILRRFREAGVVLIRCSSSKGNSWAKSSRPEASDRTRREATGVYRQLQSPLGLKLLGNLWSQVVIPEKYLTATSVSLFACCMGTCNWQALALDQNRRRDSNPQLPP